MPVVPQRLKQHAPLIALLLLICALAPSYWTALHTPAVGIYHDDSLYLITARALAEGRGYTIESTPGAIAQTKYPVLFPALLAIVWKLAPEFPSNVILFKSVALLGSMIWLALSYLLIRRESGNPWLPAIAVGLTASSPQVVFISTAVLSESSFAAVATASLLALSLHARTQSRISLVTAAVMATAAYHTRTIGFCLILAGIAALLLRGKRKDALLFTGICATLAAPWIVWQALHRTVADPYLSQQNYYSAYNIVVNFTWPEKIQIALTNLLFIPFSVQNLFHLSWGGVIGLVALPLITRSLYRSGLALPIRCFLLGSGTVILLWVWPPLRFLIPLLPLLVLAVFEGAPKKLQTPILICTVLLALQGLRATHQFSIAASNSGLWYPQPTQPEAWTAFADQLDWVRTHTSPAAILQSNVDPTVYLFTGRHAVRGSHGNASLGFYLDRPAPLGDAGQFAQTLTRNQVSYLLDTPWDWFLETTLFTGLIEQNRQADPASLTLQHESVDPKFRIFRFNPPQTSGQNLK
jgi:hypothetical protein